MPVAWEMTMVAGVKRPEMTARDEATTTWELELLVTVSITAVSLGME